MANSKLPSGEKLSKPMTAYLQMIESRQPSQTDALATDGSVALTELIVRFNTLIKDLSK
jgi:hypothetical protein